MSKDKDMIEFRTAFRGYAKEDVNRYLEEINQRFAETERRLQKNATRLSDENKQLNQTIDDLRQKLSEKETTPETDAVILSLNNRIEELSREKEELLSALNLTQSEKDQLSEIVSTSEEALEKATMYDSVSSQIGSLMVDANAAKENIIRNAIEKAKQDSDALRKKESDFLSRTMNEAAESISSEYAEILSEWEALGKKLTDLSESMKVSLKEKCDAASETIEKDCLALASGETTPETEDKH